MQVGTPAVTTSIGAEAMTGGLDWNGEIVDDLTAFAAQAAALYQDKHRWLQAQKNGILIINERYKKSNFSAPFLSAIQHLSASLAAHRRGNFIGQLLQFHTANSTKYMSLWISEKKLRNPI
ncbi:hypothetical protein [Pedobacter steynii]|uniref:hypothetical protein n=1 Tax=Pedobacter steynii TaxID=430522 RepID=UPI000AF52B5F|nr:hypothetical protein [Pedobacter steynii]